MCESNFQPRAVLLSRAQFYFPVSSFTFPWSSLKKFPFNMPGSAVKQFLVASNAPPPVLHYCDWSNFAMSPFSPSRSIYKVFAVSHILPKHELFQLSRRTAVKTGHEMSHFDWKTTKQMVLLLSREQSYLWSINAVFSSLTFPKWAVLETLDSWAPSEMTVSSFTVTESRLCCRELFANAREGRDSYY